MSEQRLLGGLSSDKEFLATLVARRNLTKSLTSTTLSATPTQGQAVSRLKRRGDEPASRSRGTPKLPS